VTVNDVLRRFVPEFRRTKSTSPWAKGVLDWLCACRTAALGGRMLSCACGWSRPVYNSCGNRHCPTCRAGARAEWLAARRLSILPVPHFQVVFTLPGALRTVARANPRIVYPLLFRAAAQTLQQLAAERLGAQLGLLGVLHTWANDLVLHPHVHFLVTAGGLDVDRQRWVETGDTYLFPTRVMAALFRGKVLEALRKYAEAGSLWPPRSKDCGRTDGALRAAYRHRWVVHVEPPNGRRAETAAAYLARYVAGTALSNRRIVGMSKTHVTFQTRRGPMRLSGVEFVRRFASHILPPRQHRVRYYGLYAPGNLHTRWVLARRLLDVPFPAEPPPRPKRSCPECGGVLTESSIPGLPRCRPARPPQARGPP